MYLGQLFNCGGKIARQQEDHVKPVIPQVYHQLQEQLTQQNPNIRTSDYTFMFSLEEWDSWFKDNLDLEKVQ